MLRKQGEYRKGLGFERDFLARNEQAPAGEVEFERFEAQAPVANGRGRCASCALHFGPVQPQRGPSPSGRRCGTKLRAGQ